MNSKKLLLILMFTFVQVHGEEQKDSVTNSELIQRTTTQILNIEKKVDASLEFLNDVKEYMIEYETFSKRIYEKAESLITEGATCKVLEARYLESKQNSKYEWEVKLLKKGINECYEMYEIRTESIKSLHKSFLELEEHIIELGVMTGEQNKQNQTNKARIKLLKDDMELYRRKNEEF
jgi:hypothetical protein